MREPDHHPRWRRLIAAVALLGAAACGDDSGTATESTAVAGDPPVTTSTTEAVAPTGTEGTGATSSYRVTVEEAGAEPRRELRLGIQPGDVDRVTQRQEISIEIRAGDQVQAAPTPITEIDFTHTVEEVADDRVSSVGTYDDVRVLDTPGVDQATLDQTRGLLSGFLTATSSTTSTIRGAVLEARIEGLQLSGELGPLMEQLAASITDSAESMSVPFPVEPVGRGARWRVEADVEIAGLPVQIITTVTLTDLATERAAGTIEQTMRFVPGGANVLGTPLTVVGGELRGGGPIEWDLAGGLLPRSDVTISGTTVLEVDGTRIEQHQDQRITISAR